MREIKFRVWDKDLKKMFPVVRAVWIDGKIDSTMEWMQYTGLKDKNGKEIYEGDIIYRKRPGMFSGFSDKEEKSVVTWNKKECGFCSGESSTSIFYSINNQIPYFVIGNIYENPELLKGDK